MAQLPFQHYDYLFSGDVPTAKLGFKLSSQWQCHFGPTQILAPTNNSPTPTCVVA